MRRLVAADPELQQRLSLLVSIPGIAETTAMVLVIEMPELGTLTPKQAASLAGLAPMTRQSGRWQGRTRIGGGRKTVRDALYMPALIAIRCNPGLARQYNALSTAGKPAKLAITAAMRKLITYANAVLRENRPWAENAA